MSDGFKLQYSRRVQGAARFADLVTSPFSEGSCGARKFVRRRRVDPNLTQGAREARPWALAMDWPECGKLKGHSFDLRLWVEYLGLASWRTEVARANTRRVW